MTYKEIINRFRTVTEEHLMLQDFGYGQLSDLKTQSQLGPEEQGVDYPYLFLLPATSNRTQSVMNYSFNMIVMDMARGEEGDAYDNYITIQSQCQQYIDDVLARLYYYYKDQPEINLTNISYTPFKEKYQDDLAGMTATITISVPAPINECIAPFAPAVSLLPYIWRTNSVESVMGEDPFELLNMYFDTPILSGDGEFTTDYSFKFSENTNIRVEYEYSFVFQGSGAYLFPPTIVPVTGPKLTPIELTGWPAINPEQNKLYNIRAVYEYEAIADMYYAYRLIADDVASKLMRVSPGNLVKIYKLT